MSESGPISSAPPRLFDPGQVYTVPEIAERMKCSERTVDREVKKHKLRCIRFGTKKYLGGELNRIVESEITQG